MTQNNGVTMTSGNILTTSDFGLDWTQLLEMDVNVPTATTGHLEAFGYIGSNGINGAAIDYADQAASNTFVLYEDGVGYPQNAVPTPYTQGSPSLYTFYFPANYVFASAQNLEGPNANAYFEFPYGSGGTASPIGMSATGTGNPGLFLQWARIRVFQPDGNMPLDFYGPLITAPTVAITAGPSSLTADAGQYETFTATVSNGQGSYTYNWLVVNSISNKIVGNYLFISPTSTNTLTFQLTSADAYNSPEYVNVIVTDATPNTYNSIYSSTYVVNPAISITSVWSSNNIADQLQYETMTGSWTGGTSAFTVNFYITNTINGNVIANSLTAATSPVTFTFRIPQTNNALGAPQIKFTVKDSISGSASTTNTFGVNSILVASAPTASNTIIDNGQYTTFTAHPSGGTAAYSYLWYSGSSATCSSDTSTGVTTSTYTTQPSSSSTYYCYRLTDSASTNNVVYSSGLQITVNSQPTITISPSSSSINIGQTVSYTANIPSGIGVGPFTVNLVYNGNAVATNSIPIGGGTATLAYVPVDIGTLTFNVAAADTGAAYLFNSISNTIAVTSVLSNSITNVVVTVSSGTSTSLDYTFANTILTITSSNSILANVLITNVTGNYLSTTNPGSILVVLNFSATSNTPSTISFTVKMDVPCGTNAAPYKLESGTWVSLPYTYVAACTVSFTVPSDPTIGLFTLPSSGGGGSIGSGGTGGGPLGAFVTKFSQNGASCYRITNFTIPDSETFALNGTTFTVVASSIMPASAALIINNRTYVLALNQSVNLGLHSNYSYTTKLERIQYLPILHMVNANICSMPITTTSTTTITSTSTTISSTIPATTSIVPITTTTVPYAPKYGASTQTLIGGIIAMAIVAGVIYYHFIKGKNKK